MIEAPELVELPIQPVARIHLDIPSSEIRSVMGPGIREIYETLGAQGIKPAGAWLTHHLQKPGERFVFEICVPIAGNLKPSGRVEPGNLRATKAARALYTGPYEGLGNAWGQHLRAIEAKGWKTAEDLWEVYLVGPESTQDESKYQTELVRPLL
ncbi:MAG: GyrI-like domain-containing protein [Myxococcota bacterium]